MYDGSRKNVTLREITEETLRPILDLEVKPEQADLVAPNAVSIAQAHFAEDAWFRAIYADDTPVGFLMLSDQPAKPRYYLWRFMIDRHHQGKGYGIRAMELLIEHVRTRPGATALFVSYVPDPAGPKGFYEKLGFVDTGRVHGGEHEMRLDFEAAPQA